MVGQYHWVAALAPKFSRSIASWFTGWISVGGQIVLSASAAFAGGFQFQGLFVLNHPDTYMPQRWHGVLFYWLVLAYSAASNIWGSKLLTTTNGIMYLGTTLSILLTVRTNRCRGPPHCWVFCHHRRTWCHVAQTQRRIRLRRFLNHERLVK